MKNAYQEIFLEKAIDWLKKEKYPYLKNHFQSKKFLKDLERIKKGEPIDYVIGFSYFLNTKIDLRYKPFIPRDETEYLAQIIINEIDHKNFNKKIKILDLFAGSGCLGISFLKNIKNCEVHFAEKYKKFLKQIQINLKLNNLEKKKFRLIKADVFKGIKEKYDLIVANPPYVGKITSSVKKVIQWEPKEALLSKNRGLFFIKKIISEGKKFLKDKGIIYLEFDSWQKKSIEREILKDRAFSYLFLKDQFNKWRFLKLEKPSCQKTKKMV